ncbi:MAG: hypothetical protein ACM3VZ_06350 [Acidobacteriota bacterium]
MGESTSYHHLMDLSIATQGLGITLPTPAYLIGMLIFSIIGMVAYYRGKASHKPKVRWLGLALMLYPYAVSSTAWLYLVGVSLSVAAGYAERHP